MNINSRGYKILELCASNKVISEKRKCEYACLFNCTIMHAQTKHGREVSPLFYAQLKFLKHQINVPQENEQREPGARWRPH